MLHAKPQSRYLHARQFEKTKTEGADAVSVGHMTSTLEE